MALRPTQQIQELYSLVWQEVASVHHVWNLHSELFFNEEHVAVLQRTAPHYFKWVGPIFEQKVCLAISRLLDSAKGKRPKTDRASIDGLRLAIHRAGNTPLAQELSNDRTALCTRAEAVLEARNKKLAHSDVATLLHRGTPRQVIDRIDVFDLLSLLREYMWKVEEAYGFPPTAFESTNAGSGVKSLIWYLKLGLEADEHQRNPRKE